MSLKSFLFGRSGAVENKGASAPATITSPSPDPIRSAGEFAGRGAAVLAQPIEPLTRSEARKVRAEEAKGKRHFKTWEELNVYMADALRQDEAKRRQRQLDEFLQVVRDPRNVRPFERAGRWPVNVLLAEIIAEIKGELVSLDALGAHDESHKFGARRLEEFARDSHRDLKKTEDAEILESLLANENPSLDLPHSRERRIEALKQRRRLLKEYLKDISKEAAIIVYQNAKIIAEACGRKADALEAEERAAHAKGEGRYGWEFQASRKLATLRQLQHWRLVENLPGHVSWFNSPKSLAEAIGIKL